MGKRKRGSRLFFFVKAGDREIADCAVIRTSLLQGEEERALIVEHCLGQIDIGPIDGVQHVVNLI